MAVHEYHDICVIDAHGGGCVKKCGERAANANASRAFLTNNANVHSGVRANTARLLVTLTQWRRFPCHTSYVDFFIRCRSIKL